ncbi:hypothetical protein BDD12DRAFT_852537 [Trichophaea hybrida]|nr:hypothetical protein BDD12DRAFT_852537 [Trichophaea hybrida]
MVLLSNLFLLLPAIRVLACALHRPSETMEKVGVERRDSIDGKCGAVNKGQTCSGSSVNKCCSQYGWCGDTVDHCGTGCQSAYGTCSTSPVPTLPTIGPRPKLGNVPYGTDIFACTKPGKIALTFDDGPWYYTAALLDLLKLKSVKATFFITGNNLGKGEIDGTSTWRTLIQRIYNEGHQVASHTWTHPDLSLVDETTRRYEMIRNEQALLSILGRYPTYMRPPYISCGTACRNTMDALGYHVIIWDLDTDDYNNDSPTLIQNSKDRVKVALAQKWDAYMSIAHDIHYQTVYNLTAYQIDAAKAAGYNHVRLGECLSDPEVNWYRTAL